MNKFFNKLRTKVGSNRTIGPLNNHPDIANYLNKPLGRGTTLLHLAVITENVNNVKVLLEAGADPTLADNSKNTPLHFAKSQDIIKLLLQHKADIDAKNMIGLSFLDTVLSYDNYELLEYLLKENLVDSENVARRLGIEQSANTETILNTFYRQIEERHVEGDSDDDDTDYYDESDEDQSDLLPAHSK